MHMKNFKCLKKSTLLYVHHNKLILKILRINPFKVIYIINFKLSFLKQSMKGSKQGEKNVQNLLM